MVASIKARPTIDAMVKSRWVYHKLKNFRAGMRPTYPA